MTPAQFDQVNQFSRDPLIAVPDALLLLYHAMRAVYGVPEHAPPKRTPA